VAEVEVGPGAGVEPGPAWWGIEELARRVGAYCWAEHRLFELTGRWASGTGDPEIRLFFSVASAHHAALAGQWRDRLPVRAGVDVAALVAAPDVGAAEASSLLDDQAAPLFQLGGLVNVVLPRLRSAYAAHLARATPVSEGPVMAVLSLIEWSDGVELARGRDLLADRLAKGRVEGDAPDAEAEVEAENVAEFCRLLERRLESHSDKSPDAWAS
jgi:hypothetical protein